MELNGKVAIVTGASQGLGRAYALTLAQAGAAVIATSRRMGAPAPGEPAPANSLAETAHIAAAKGYNVTPMVCDVGDERQIERLADFVIAAHGRIDVIVNNAATYPGDQPHAHTDVNGISREEWRHYLDVNVLGPYSVIAKLAPYMAAQGSGSIVNLTSIAGRLSAGGMSGQNGMLPYCVTKAALDRLTTYFADMMRPAGVAVNALNPGVVLTHSLRSLPQELQDQLARADFARRPTPEAVGPPLLFLARQTAEGVTGQVLDADSFGKDWG